MHRIEYQTTETNVKLVLLAVCIHAGACAHAPCDHSPTVISCRSTTLTVCTWSSLRTRSSVMYREVLGRAAKIEADAWGRTCLTGNMHNKKVLSMHAKAFEPNQVAPQRWLHCSSSARCKSSSLYLQKGVVARARFSSGALCQPCCNPQHEQHAPGPR